MQTAPFSIIFAILSVMDPLCQEKIFKEKQMFTLFKIKENFPIGFDDFLDEENEKKNLFKAYCIIDSEVLVISRENLNEIIYKEIEVRKVEKNYVIKN